VIAVATRGTPNRCLTRTVLGRVTTRELVSGIREDHVLVVAEDLPDACRAAGYVGTITNHTVAGPISASWPGPLVHSAARLDHLQDGDVVSLDATGYVRTLYRIASRHNAIFATDRCNSYCLMCSQPPRELDDRDRVAEHFRLIELMDPATAELGITGGEPTLLKDDFIELVRRCKERMPNTALHVLSNGRLFYYGRFARKLAEVNHPDLMIGIPLYSDIDAEHDYVVQCRGAFDDTVIGLQNLGRFGVPVEIRTVTHRLTAPRLSALSEFVYRNLPFASHVTFMGLEMMGFAIPNVSKLWIDPWDYREELERAVLHLSSRGMRVSVYNHQLCTLPVSLWPYSRASISDWKNEYLPRCGTCMVRDECGGFFLSSVERGRVSVHIEPFVEDPRATTGGRRNHPQGPATPEEA